MSELQTIQKIIGIIDYVETDDNINYDSSDAYHDICIVIQEYQQLKIEELTKK